MPQLHMMFDLESCPHCGINRPSLQMQNNFETLDHKKENRRVWFVYVCANCGGVVTAAGTNSNQYAREYYPTAKEVDESLPEKAKAFLHQAISSIHAPAGSVMLSASCVDAMLKEKGYIEGSLYKRIEKAIDDNLITPEMAKWAHEVRLDANDQRHADVDAVLPKEEDARRVVEFVEALAEFLFILPLRVQRGISSAEN